MNRPDRKRLASGGFTLVEVLISLFLVVMVLGGSYGVIVRAQELTRAARNHYVAATIAKNRLERARNFQYDSNLMLLQESAIVVDDNGLPMADGWFQRQTIINTNYAAGLTEVKVVVKIRNRRTGAFGVEKEESSTLFTKYLSP